MPELSVLMGTYNEKKAQVRRAVDSILGQTFTDFELIICDDGSRQAFYQWLQEYCKKDARIRLVRNEQNRGLAAVLNRCLSLSSGRFVARMDADDVSLPERFAKQLAFLKEHLEYAFVAGSAYLMDKYGIWGIRRPAEIPKKEDFLRTSPFIHPTVMFRREALADVRGYCESEKVKRVEDYELFMRMYAAGYKGYNMQEPLFEYREDDDAYAKRRFCCRLNECRVRRNGFLRLGISHGNLGYIVKPLAAGLAPASVKRKLHVRRYGIKDSCKNEWQGQNQNRNKTIRIYVAHSPDSSHLRLKSPLFYHVAAGSTLWKQPVPKGMLTDHTGMQISEKNRSYCELTVQYWAWKNEDADMYGFCHYRRYFSFASRMLPCADCGFPVFAYMDRQSVRRMHLDETAIRRIAGQYDFLIAKGISVRPWAKNVYDNFKKAPHLHVQDLDLFLEIICRRYPQLRMAVKEYMEGSIFYPFNMFLMKRELFQEYCTMLFAALEEFEQYADMSRYSREALRTPGHLGERFAGIYYRYLLQKGGCRLGELQSVLFEQTDRREAASKKERTAAGVKNSAGQPQRRTDAISQEVLVVLAADRYYAPVVFVCLKSLCSHASPDRKYHICLLHTDMDQASMERFQKEFSNGNIRMDFRNVKADLAGYHLKGKGSITAETFYRFLILDVFGHCPKAVYLDADTIVCDDIAKLYDLKLGDCLLAAAPDVDVIGQYNGANPDTRHYQEETLKLADPYSYIQAGVLVINIKQFQKAASARWLLTMAQQGDYRYSDQDILNIVCQGRIRYLDLSWNVLMDCSPLRSEVIRHAPAYLQEAYEHARKNPRIIHYCGSPKPWEDPAQDFAEQFWRTARQTPYYEILLHRMAGQKKKRLSAAAVDALRHTAKKVLPQGSFLRRMVGMIYWKLK